ncbi:MAG: hypothetical protein O7A98_09435 [Acidobacteria bacterium]|nr:hypothetical protein [Acidobacteriota bacterium]
MICDTSSRTLRAVSVALLASLGVVASARGEVTHRLSVSTGVGLTADADLDIRQPERGTSLVFRDVAFDDKSLALVSAPYMAVRWTRWTDARPRLAVSLEFLHFKIFAETERTYDVEGSFRGIRLADRFPMNSVVQQYDVSNGVNMILVNAAYRRDDLMGGRLEVYVGSGLGPTVPYTRATIEGIGGDGHYEMGRIGGQVFGGALWPVSGRWDLFVEGKWTRTTVDGSVPGGTSAADLSTRHLTVGVGYRF